MPLLKIGTTNENKKKGGEWNVINSEEREYDKCYPLEEKE